MNRKKINQFFNTLIYKESDANSRMYGLEFWRNRIFSLLSFFLIVLGGPIMLYGAYLFYLAGSFALAGIEVAIFIIIAIAVYKKQMRMDIRKFLVILSIYCLSILLLVYTGPYGAGMISVVFTFVLAVSLLNKEQNQLFFIINIIVFIMLTFLLGNGIFNGMPIELFAKNWLINAFVAQICVTVLIYLFNMIYDGLESQTREIIESQALIAVSEEKYRLLADTTADVIWVFNVTTRKFVYISPSIRELRGYTVEEAMTERLEESMLFDSYQNFIGEITQTIPEFVKNPTVPKRYIMEIQQPCKNGDIVWVETSSRYRYNNLDEIEVVSSSRNINERKLKEEEFHYIDFHDQLTGLLNRKALTNTYHETKPKKSLASVIIINIDNFRIINEALGHQEGDRVLLDWAIRILKSVGSNGVIYRYGGDEFVIIVESTECAYVQSLGKELLKSISTQFMAAKQLFYLTASIGISVGSALEKIEQTVRNAETALYAAKKEKNKIVNYVPEMDQSRTREAILEKDLKCALENDEFELHYQPIYDLKNGVINHAEALLRWNHQEFGRIPPSDFIPIAEKTKLIIPITDWVIEQVCNKIKHWQEIGIADMTVSINISILSFENRGAELTESVAGRSRAAGINPASVKLEITESILIRDTEEIITVFQDLKKIGVKLALDDFGTGYSSFGCMKDLPLDIIKLDRSLISNIVMDEREQMIVESMITIIQGLDIQVVAEGIETEEQLRFLENYNCDFIQGFFFSRPLSPDAFENYYFSMNRADLSPTR
ncbi:MAG: bifunctional diguanylate cyclase/phosphodiesterase [Acetobacterium sp.]|nr:bifunctional diguanylate cyclase/phosphodiesterase [Bacillota bacterium]MCG2730544.1 bifunctional diguanylate cyclase/phosphodiesterase [Acetobacterium sp.]